MSLNIEFSDSPGLTIYAFLFSSANKNNAFKISSNNFDSFSLSSQSSFVISLSESSSRVGFYSYTISDTSGIPESENDQWYLVEVFRKIGTSPNRAVDKLVGATAFYWDGTKEVALSERPHSPTAQQIWEYSIRTLTQEISCPDYTDKFQEIIDLIKQKNSFVLPTTQIPTLSGAQPVSTQMNNIKFS